MRYLKVFFAVLFFFIVMMFFVQNQEVFSQKVSLNLDLVLSEPLMSAPIPLYSLFLIAFVLGAILILAMLMWDRIALSTKLTLANRKIASLNKKLELAYNAETESRKGLADAESKIKDTLAKLDETEKAMLEAKSKQVNDEDPYHYN